MPFAPTLSCMTLPYAEFPLERAFEGIARAGYREVMIYPQHQGRWVITAQSSTTEVRDIRRKAAQRGLRMPLFFGRLAIGQKPDDGAADFIRAIDQTLELGASQIMTTGTWGYKKWPDVKVSPEQYEADTTRYCKAMKAPAKHAEQVGIQIVIKPHTGNTDTSVELQDTLRRIDSPAVRIAYDCGNVRFYCGIDPVQDLKKCIQDVVAFCIKDHRGPRAHPDFPIPGEGDVDHVALFKLLKSQHWTGPMVVERVDGTTPKKEMSGEEIDRRTEKARLNLERIIAGC